jgi:hypothetical protein
MRTHSFSVNKNVYFIILSCLFISIGSCKDNISVNSPNGLVVILKADDLGDTTANWNRFIKIINDNNICASIGVIPAKVKKESSKSEIQRISGLKQDNKFPVIEFWNHGYFHSKVKGITEFSGGDMISQMNHIQLTQQFLNETLQHASHTFGAPFNRSSGVTPSALVNSPEINVWFSYQDNEKHFLPDWVDPDETVVNDYDQHIILNVDYLFLHDLPIGQVIDNYKSDKEKPYIVIQIHPEFWNDLKFKKFEKLIHFYKDKQLATFMTPYQYFKSLHKVYTSNE